MIDRGTRGSPRRVGRDKSRRRPPHSPATARVARTATGYPRDVNRQRRAPGLGDEPATRVRGGTRDRLQDAGSKELAKLAKKIGNSQVGNMLGAAREKRDALLRFIHQRLAQVQAVQKAEQDEMKDRRQWYLRLARSTPEIGRAHV